jgi:hypothetical protein
MWSRSGDMGFCGQMISTIICCSGTVETQSLEVHLIMIRIKLGMDFNISL